MTDSSAVGVGFQRRRSADVGFEAPFEMLVACHEQVERMLGLLARLKQEHLEMEKLWTFVRQALERVTRADTQSRTPLRSPRDKGHADKQQVAVGDLQETGPLQDLQGDVHSPIGVVEDQAVVNAQSRIFGI